MTNKIKEFIKSLTYTEKILMIFMSIIYTQIIFNLLFNEITNDNTSPIDTIIRTSASSIFGYFLGSEVTKKEEKKENDNVIIYKKNHKNTTIISILGIVSLLILLYVRNFTTINYSSIASLSQLKDFVSASVGYMVSKSGTKDE